MYYILCCEGPFHICSSGPCNHHRTTSLNLLIHTTHHHTAGILSQRYLIPLPGYYKQAHGTAMGSPISPIVANLFMEESETKAINTASNAMA